jgi:hypothetical protein
MGALSNVANGDKTVAFGDAHLLFESSAGAKVGFVAH